MNILLHVKPIRPINMLPKLTPTPKDFITCILFKFQGFQSILQTDIAHFCSALAHRKPKKKYLNLFLISIKALDIKGNAFSLRCAVDNWKDVVYVNRLLEF